MKTKYIKNKKILITGGLGFIGSNLAKYLSQNNNVYVIDNLFSGNLKNKHKNIEYLIANTANINKLKKIENINFSYLFHLGEYSRVEQSYEDIDEVIKLNIKSFYEVLKFSKKKKCKLIYSGSSTVFGQYEKKTDFSPYTWSKKMNIDFLKNYSEWFNLDYAIAYFYNVYGDNEINEGKYATVIAKFIKMKNQNKKFLPITSPGTQKRNFTHIKDIISGLEVIGLYGKGDGYGIGSNKSYRIIDLAKLMGMKYKLTPKKKGNRLQGKLKTEKLKRLGWKPSYNLNDFLNTKLEK